ncbi:hypothetical protein ACJJTC_004750 [Scirpophaga incertulas]
MRILSNGQQAPEQTKGTIIALPIEKYWKKNRPNEVLIQQSKPISSLRHWLTWAELCKFLDAHRDAIKGGKGTKRCSSRSVPMTPWGKPSDGKSFDYENKMGNRGL